MIVGRICSTERHKGHWQLIQSWPQVVNQVPDAQLVIVGRGDDVDRLKAKANETTSAAKFLFTGWVNEETLAALYERVAAFAMPSNGEGFGLVFLEAMKHRLPCIASRTDASREIVVDGQTGFLVNQDDHQLLSQRIVTLLTNADLRQRMGGAGFRRLSEYFSFERFEQRIVQALLPLISNGTAER
jgi:phosphatidylinositol alpha-1,6-mannosyltransferase